MPPVPNSQEFSELMKQAKELIEKKDAIEKELRQLEDGLLEVGIGMNEPLVDSQGFPRSEIDVHSVRINRNRVIHLRNDHKAIMLDIEHMLHRVHEAKRQQEQEGGGADDLSGAEGQVDEDTAMETEETPVAFAIVNAVAPDSPAFSAGLRRNDRVIKFGHLDSTNHQGLQALNGLISQSENQPVPVSLLRDGERLDFTVTPRSGWGGRGTLGCHLLPL